MKIFSICCIVFLLSLAAYAQNDPAKGNAQVKINGNSLEVVSVTAKAEQCKDQKGVTIRLKVVGTSPVDVIRYVRYRNLWGASQFMNQAVGSEIVDHHCYEKAVFNFYTRPAGSNDAFPGPPSNQ